MRSPENAELTLRLERFYDAVPRADARTEEIGSFTLFVPAAGGFPLYARPSLGAQEFRTSDVAGVRARQRDLGLPESFEWQHEATPGLASVLLACGLVVRDHPLQVLDGSIDTFSPPGDVELLELTADAGTDALAAALALANLAFSHGGTAVGDAGADALRRAAAQVGADAVERCRARLATGRASMVVGRAGETTVAVASAQQAVGVAEVVGVGTLPTHRRRGLGAAVTAAVVRCARAKGARTVFLSAGDDDIARIYARLGFLRVGTAGIATAR